MSSSLALNAASRLMAFQLSIIMNCYRRMNNLIVGLCPFFECAI